LERSALDDQARVAAVGGGVELAATDLGEDAADNAGAASVTGDGAEAVGVDGSAVGADADGPSAADVEVVGELDGSAVERQRAGGGAELVVIGDVDDAFVDRRSAGEVVAGGAAELERSGADLDQSRGSGAAGDAAFDRGGV